MMRPSNRTLARGTCAVGVAAVTIAVAIAVGRHGLSAQAPPSAPKAVPTGRLNHTIERLAQGKPVFQGIDFAFIDLEHGPYDIVGFQKTLADLIDPATSRPRLTPLVRIPMHGDEDFGFVIKQVLDSGAFGVVFPRIESREQALKAIRSMRYGQHKGSKDMEPAGLRGFGPGRAVRYWGMPSALEYVRRADVWPLDPDGELLAAIQIETAEGVKNLDQILSVPGIGAVLVGPADLGLSIGEDPVFPPQPPTEALVQEVLQGCRASKVACWYPAVEADNGATLKKRLADGWKMFLVPQTGLAAVRELAK